MPPAFAFLSHGELHVRSGDGSVQHVKSEFGEQVKERARQIHARQSWKTEGRGARFMSGGLLWGTASQDLALTQVAVRCVSRGTRPGDVLFVLDTDGLTGICAWNAGLERRLMHGSERRLENLVASPEHIACSVLHRDGTAALGLMSADATDLTEITEGDVRDQAPSFVPGASRRLVYQSAGMGRDRNGILGGVGAYAVHELDLDRGEVTTLLEEEKADLLCPRVDGEGTLYCIRRPAVREDGFSIGRFALDILLLPFRLLHAVFQFLSFFTARYTGKPLTTAGGPKQQGADARQMMIWGNLLDAQKAARDSAEAGEPKAVVPRSWKLLRRQPGGELEVIADSVGYFDLCRDGSILYTTGSAIYHLQADGKRERLHAAPLIEQVAALD
jgi:hypothetical protein